MVLSSIEVDGAGLLRSCRVEGHAGVGTRGNDIVCAAVSVLTKTVLRILSGREDIIIRGSVPGRGQFTVEVDYSPEGREFLSGAGSFLIDGLLSVQEEFPDHCKVTIERRNSYGT